MIILSTKTKIVHHDSVFFIFRNSLKLGSFAFSSFAFSYRRKVLDSSSSSYWDELIFFSRFSSPSRSFNFPKIYFAFFCSTDRFPLRLCDRVFRNFPSDSYSLLFCTISESNRSDSSEILPLAACVWLHSSIRAPSLHWLGSWLSPFSASFFKNAFSLADFESIAATNSAIMSSLMSASRWWMKISATSVIASLELLLRRLSICWRICL